MCGFVGFANAKLDIDKEKVIKDMADTIIHRGPDSEGYFTDNNVTFGFRRLQIIDLSEEASQPMYNEDKTCVMVFNGEIYNYQELRRELQEKGHIFKSNTDSEVIIHAYEEYGIELLGKIRGMFAFSIWDMKKETMFLARDFFGIKPLYYTNNTLDNSFIFGSEIKSFLKQPAFIKELNEDALRPYLTFQYSVLDETFFKGVYKLKPAHYMIYKEGKTEIKPYWDPMYKEKENSLEFYVQRIKDTVKESVKYHRISDVEVGSFLSGGVDSSYITSLLMPSKTFSVGFKDYEDIFNETNLAKDLSDILNIENHRRFISAEESFEALEAIQYHMDEPQSNPSVVPLYFLSKLASEHVTVVLSGEGADEIFGGYSWYETTPTMKKYKKIPYIIRRPVSLMSKALPQNRITSFLTKGGQKVEEWFIGQAKVFDEEHALRVLKAKYKNGPSVHSITKEVYDKVKDQDDVTKMQYIDMNLWMPGDILLKADKMSLAHSIELRVPFLDKEVMSLASQIPTRYRVNEKNSKYALRIAAKETLPEEWANRTKVGFPVPIRHWLREEKYYNIVKNMFKSDVAEEFFDTEELTRIIDEHYTGKRNYARQIWTVYVFLVWYKKYFIEL
ncbi:asparagine synthase (glutamine-hydrolysing) [Proteiniborus ethanoligenes]|uniref:asparagine synthase (glutamine-hydrolyzing) n=2 Tax=Proteiniborus ethanoligenes TaxID=415015 RepID=A0A1H3QAJ1_9FIRM|nr:asparagine synthase (glutamine-hydrolyzing) [Proteiniborus ethanoligenes]TAH63638.1 MAG: asparagine synthase (glutamine-hydrolyzing) [Gottschalkiaceae bacterium]SDZ10416.1 asparagine synthase (glutamine-hydrolysing) [Proteiniborus ethanoligenes]